MDKLKITYLLAVSIALAMSIISWWLLVAAAGISIVYNLAGTPHSRKSDHKLLAFAKEFKEDIYERGLNAALSRSIRSDSAPNELKELSKRAMLGEIGPAMPIHCEDDNTKELIEIIGISLQNGTDIKNNLDLFISRLESEMENKNQSIQSSLNMNTLSILGVSFFVPLFGGIGSSIISSSGILLGTASTPQVIPFQAVVVIYIAVMSYTMYAFDREKGKSALFNSFQTTVIGAGIIKASAALMAYAI